VNIVVHVETNNPEPNNSQVDSEQDNTMISEETNEVETTENVLDDMLVRPEAREETQAAVADYSQYETGPVMRATPFFRSFMNLEGIDNHFYHLPLASVVLEDLGGV